MKYSIYIVLCLILISCTNNEVNSSKTLLTTKMLVLNKDDFNKKLASTRNAQLIDVRTPEEFGAGSIPNAINIDFYSDDFEAKLLSLDKEKPVFVYCKSGGRSGKTAQKLATSLYTEVYDLKGGFSNWSK